MPILDEFLRLPLSAITITRDSRQRREIITDSLERSISKLGVLQPIIVDRNHRLIAGERRLEASRRLGLADIPVRYADQLSPIESKIMELEENVKRLDLTWQERVQATSQIHQLFVSLDEDWTQEQTAEQLALADHTTVSKYLRVAQVLDDERISGCKTFNEALNVLQRRQDRQAGSALDALLDSPALLAETPTATPFIVGSSPATSTSSQLIPVPTPTPIPPIICANFAEWAATYSGPKFNLVHCDFPYGIKMFSGPQSRGSGGAAAGAPTGPQANPEDLQFYADDPEIFKSLTETLCHNLDKLMSTSAHLMFWYSGRYQDWLQAIFRELVPGLIFQTFPLIWHKTDNAGIASDPSRGPRHIYETCLLASRGDRKIVRVVGDVYGCPTDKRIHPSCKPEPMLRHFMSMLVDEHSRVFDPTAGSGSALAAAEALGASAVLGLEIDQGVADLANQALRQGRAKRLAGGVI